MTSIKTTINVFITQEVGLSACNLWANFYSLLVYEEWGLYKKVYLSLY